MKQHGISFDGVWKKFRRGDHVDTLRDLIPGLFKKSVTGPDGLDKREFWAVKDVSFEVKPGECLGIIGPNGAGKSTVLKLLTRILRPNRGHCELRGRVGSLIEISAGFHADLTGRENIFLQGAIMGMKRTEIHSKFDAIVDFSGISEFLDTPVRRYSSGMNARLGFSIAAHLNPEVLVIDEVLSVGDLAFQQRAFGRIQDMVSGNIAAVLVTHQLEKVSQLCQSAILLKKGSAVFQGSAADTITAYTEEVGEPLDMRQAAVKIDGISGLDAEVAPGEPARFRVTGQVLDGEKLASIGGVNVRIRSLQNAQILFSTSTVMQGVQLPSAGPFELDVQFEMNVGPGVYAIETGVLKQDKRIATGPRATINVSRDFSFKGRAFARPSMRLVTHERTPEPVNS